jgi:hypothetical protein
MLPVRSKLYRIRPWAPWAFVVASCLAQDSTPPVQLARTSHVDSIWAVTFDVKGSPGGWQLRSPSGKLPEQPKKFFLIKAGGEAAAIDADSATAVRGSIAGSRFTFELGKDLRATLEGLEVRDSPSGTLASPGGEIRWKAVKLGSVWICGNHYPKYHAATTDEEMRADTKEYKCERWHVLKTD